MSRSHRCRENNSFVSSPRPALGWRHDVRRPAPRVARGARARPTFAVTVALLMALTIGANTAVFSLIDSVLLSALPFRDPDRLVVVTATRADSQQEPFSIPDFRDVRDRPAHSMRSFPRFSGAPI